MQFVIDDVKEKLSALVASIQRMVPTSRIGIVVYRDRGDDYVVRWTDLSFNTKKLQDFLAGISARGGGDWEEAVRDALDAAVNDLKWRKQSKRLIVLVGGSPPHQVDESAVRRIVRNFREDGGYVSAIDVTHRMHEEFDRNLWKSLHGTKPYQPSPFPDYFKETARTFADISRDGGGELVVLDQDKALMRSIFELTFGSRWKTEMAKYLNDLS
ncbi:VWA domain-containing protein [Candidatus Binatia bacterium]|nr:VWA domain-containing protein [Candidatus Binatia bacterium]